MQLLNHITNIGLAALCLLPTAALARPAPAKSKGAKGGGSSTGGGSNNAPAGNCIINLAFGNGNTVPINGLNADYVIGNLSKIQPKPSAIVPLLYNTNLSDANPHLNPQFIQVMNWLSDQGIPFYPAIDMAGSSPGGKINTTAFAQIATEYAKWTDRIQIGAANTVYYPSDPQGFIDTMHWLNQSLGFKHIQLNGWPKNSVHGGLVNFNNPAIDSVWYEVSNNSWAVNTYHLPNYFAMNPNIDVMVNYENPTQQSMIARMSPQAQQNAFQGTVNSIQTSPYGSGLGVLSGGGIISQGNNSVHWTVPWSQTYSPTNDNSVWNFVLSLLADINGLQLNVG